MWSFRNLNKKIIAHGLLFYVFIALYVFVVTPKEDVWGIHGAGLSGSVLLAIIGLIYIGLLKNN